MVLQAEDGMRDLVRSRGLGDVYKRQAGILSTTTGAIRGASDGETVSPVLPVGQAASARTVSYTHLTLPTSDLV